MLIGIGCGTEPEVISFVKRLGCDLIRTGVAWDRIEYVPGEYNWNELDHCAEFCKNTGTKWLPMIMGPQQHYLSTDENILATPYPDSWQYTLYKDKSLDITEDIRWQNVIKMFIERYGDNIWAYELWHDPPTSLWRGTLDEYVEFVRRTTQLIKSIDNKALVLAGSFGYIPSTKELFEKGIGETGIDMVGLYLYHRTKAGIEEMKVSLESQMLQFKEILSSSNVKPIITETGFAAESFNPSEERYVSSDGLKVQISQMEQRILLTYVLHKARKLEFVATLIHNLRDIGRKSVWGDWCGLLTKDLTPRLAFDAVRNFIKQNKILNEGLNEI